jgi:choline dehydrogenase-like flavoprotein
MAVASEAAYDAIVVGTGPGGATVARELSARRRKVLLLERGSEAPVDDSLRKQAGATRLNFVGRGIPVVKGVTLGGTSMLYYATAFQPPLEMFRAHGIELAEEVAEIERELPIAEFPDPAVGPRADRIMTSARDLGYDWRKLAKFVHAEKCDGGVPYEAKWNARAYVREAQRNGAVLETRARALRVLVEDGTAVGVEYRQRGSNRQAFARHVIASAGGVGSPVLLAASGIANAGEGFFCDPLVIVNGFVEDVYGAPEAPMAAGVHMQDDGYMLTDLAHQRALYWAFSAQTLRFGRLLAHPRTLSIMVKAKDGIGGRIGVNGRVRRIFAKQDVDKLRHGTERARSILENAGARNIFRYGIAAAHPGGSVRVGEALDSNLRSEIDNLYVCDCSVIPEPWGLPPTFRLIALGKRLAKHLTRDGG